MTASTGRGRGGHNKISVEEYRRRETFRPARHLARTNGSLPRPKATTAQRFDINGGRYGSLDEKGIGYTEKEYDYARASNKPVLALLHEKPGSLAREKTDTDESAWKKLQAFRGKVEKHHTCVYWTTVEDLKAKVIVGIITQTKRHPAVGWVRADQVPSQATLSEILKLRSRIADLESELASETVGPVKGTEELKQGDETFTVNYTFETVRATGTPSFTVERLEFDATLEPSWNEIFAAVAPLMINEASSSQVKQAIARSFLVWAKASLAEDKELEDVELQNFVFDSTASDTIVIQLRALRLIEQSVRQRSLRDTGTYWRLTKHGDQLLTQLRAIRREPRSWPTASLVDFGDAIQEEADREADAEAGSGDS
jgi:hypothetical protein